MKLVLISIFVFGFLSCFNAQVLEENRKNNDNDSIPKQEEIVRNSSEKDSMKIFKPTIADYLSFSEFGDKKHIDTTLTYNKSYIFTQYNNKDNFGRIAFSNIGSGFNPLTFEYNSFGDLSLLPTNKSYFIFAPQDIQYYDVKTPTTSFIYHNGVNNGVALTSTYTQNIRKDFNISAQYMGLRSRGNYESQLAVSNNVIFTTNYKSRNKKYQIYAHFLDQNIRNEENGGIQDNDLFLSGAATISNRANLLVNLSGSNTRFSLRRYYFTQKLNPFNNTKIPFGLKHVFSYQSNKFYYGEPSVQKFYYTDDSELVDYPTHTGKYSKNLSNTFLLSWDNDKFRLDAGIRHQWIRLGFSDDLRSPMFSLPSSSSEQRFGAIGNLETRLWEMLQTHSSAEISRGDLLGNYISWKNTVKFEPIKKYFVEGNIDFQSAYPSINLMLNASPYRKHNYFNTQWKSQNMLTIGGKITVPWFDTQIYGKFRNVDNYTYLNNSGLPEQTDASLSIAELGGETTLRYGKIHFNTRLHFQKIISGKTLLPLPDFIGRVNIFYQSKIFKNAAEIQSGIKMNYFNTFASREYFPLVNEYMLPSTSFLVGGKPIVDAYINMKVKRMFVFVEGQNLLSTVQKNTIYTAPNHPFQDFRLNIGIVWYLIN